MIESLKEGVECWLLDSMHTSNNLYYAYAGIDFELQKLHLGVQ